MTDEEYMYRADVREKSQLAKNARNSYSQRRRGCRLPSDSLTKRERAKLNGPTYSIQLDVPMAWADFKDKPESLQKQYIDAILAKYRVGPAAIGKMFGISGAYCGSYLARLGYSFKKRTRAEEALRFLTEFGRGTDITEDHQPDEPMPVKRVCTEKIALSFVGAFTLEAIIERLKSVFPEGETAAVTIEVAKVAEI